MSVLVRALPSKDPKLLHVYVKGAPETIKRHCIPETSELIALKACRPFTYAFLVCRPFTYNVLVRRTFTCFFMQFLVTSWKFLPR